MDRYFTIMLVPEREKGVKSFRIPRVVLHAALFSGIIFVTLLGILSYDYWKILQQVYENKHLSRENRQLREQIQLFQMKINSLTKDLERIHIFEKKLRIITGLEDIDTTKPIYPEKFQLEGDEKEQFPGATPQTPVPKKGRQGSVDPDTKKGTFSQPETLFSDSLNKKLKDFQDHSDYIDLRKLYEQKIASTFGLSTGYTYTKNWLHLTQKSFALAEDFADFDYKFSVIKNFTKNLESNIHNLDNSLLDNKSRLNSTPTLLPTRGWITSFYGRRVSPTSRRIRMHEGIDVGSRPGNPIISPADGRIVYSGTKPGFGKFIQIDHGYGIETFYAHNKRLFVKKGQVVSRGDRIASVGSTGASTGPHLHYEVRVNGSPVDPLYYALNAD